MKPVASLSLDLDDQWTYLKIHGEPRWKRSPSLLALFVPRLLEFLADLDLKITVFIVGYDASLERHHALLAELARAGHEIGNHSFHHEPWLHLYSRDELASEISRAEDAIGEVTGVRTRGFRGPGYSLTRDCLSVLAERGYRYDATTVPTFLGPLSRAFYFRSARFDSEQKKRRERLFGHFRDVRWPLGPYRVPVEGRSLIEVPVTTMPLFRTPIHFTYLHYLEAISAPLASSYFNLGLWLCRATGVAPSIVLHPLDFLGHDDTEALSFFPAMQEPSELKLARTRRYLAALTRRFQVVPIARQLDLLEREGPLEARRLDPG